MIALLLAMAQNIHADTTCIVTKTIPIYKTIKVRTPHTTSYQERVSSRTQCGYTYQEQSKSDIGVDTIIGSIAGGFLGNQVGGGSGKDWATVGGALGGGYIANQTRSGNYNRVPKYCDNSHYETRYRTTYTYETVSEVVGYTNYFTYDGVQYTKQSSSPLKTVNVRTNISY
jgi:uncharacterized protein YcfJ